MKSYRPLPFQVQFSPLQHQYQSIIGSFCIPIISKMNSVSATVTFHATVYLCTYVHHLNARVGRDSEVWGSVIGRHGEAVRNESGEQLLRFCAVNVMLVYVGVPMQRVEEHHRLLSGEKGRSSEGKRC